MAAHIEGKGCSVLDMTGLSQKGGAVFSHIRIGRRPEDVHGVRIADGDANVLLGCDLVVSAGDESLSKLDARRTHAGINTFETVTGAFTRNPDLHTPTAGLLRSLEDAPGAPSLDKLEPTTLATARPGDSIAPNPSPLRKAGPKWRGRVSPQS